MQQKTWHWAAQIQVRISIPVFCMTEKWVTQWSRPALSGGNSTIRGMHMHPDSYLHADITRWNSPFFFSSFLLLTDTWTSADWKHPEISVNGNLVGVRDPQLEKLARKSGLCKNEAQMNWKHTMIQSYFPLISKPYGWISWNSWGNYIWQCLIHEFAIEKPNKIMYFLFDLKYFQTKQKQLFKK